MLDATPLLRAYAWRRLRRLEGRDPVRAQEAQLRALLHRARDTRFGRAHEFASIRTVEDYQRRVQLRSYEEFWAEWWQDDFPTLRDVTWPGLIPYFAQTSGTTGAVTKSIPISREMVAGNKRAALDVLAFHVRNRPDSRVLAGKNLVLGGSTDLVERAPGVRAGDLSGIAAIEVPFWAQSRFFPPRDLALTADWDAKIDALARRSLAEDIRSLSGTPSWMLLFFERLAALKPGAPRRLAALYPRLELIIHGGVSFTPYRRSFAEWLEGSATETREVFPASEGFVAAADRGPDAGLRMMIDNGIFYEFLPMEDGAVGSARYWLGTAHVGVNYALAVTTNAGLWSYLLGDTVMLTELDPPRLHITGRTAYALSVFGEHLIGEEIEAAVAAAAEAVGATVADFCVTPVYPDAASARGTHRYFVEFERHAPAKPQQDRFIAVVDQELARRNADYADHRRGDFGMAPPLLTVLPHGAFEAWMRKRGRLGGQNKVPRVIRDDSLREDLERFVAHVAGC